jgi:4-aminobutyrate aminotransferase-like enzyme
LKFKPPMVFGMREADILCAALETAFADLAACPTVRP